MPGRRAGRGLRGLEEAKVKSLDFILSALRSQWNIFRQGNYVIWLLCEEVEQDEK